MGVSGDESRLDQHADRSLSGELSRVSVGIEIACDDDRRRFVLMVFRKFGIDVRKELPDCVLTLQTV